MPYNPMPIAAVVEDEAEVANGFLVLDHCDVYLVARGAKKDDEKNAARVGTPPMGKDDPWFDVEIPTVVPQDLAENRRCRQAQAQAQAHEGVDGSSSRNVANANVNANISCVDHRHCPHCCLVLAKDLSFREKTTQQMLRITTNDGDGSSSKTEGSFDTTSTGPRYDGTIRGTKCRYCGSGRQRSDAALMMGLALQSQDLGHVVIRSIRVGLYKNAIKNKSKSKNSISPAAQFTPKTPKPNLNNSNSSNVFCRKEKACLLISFWCREIVDLDVPPSQQHQQRRFFERSTKQLLHPATQLILSIMSSDWREYDAKIAEVSFLASSYVVEKHRSKKSKTSTDDDIDTIDENESNKTNGMDTDTNLIPTIHQQQQRIPYISFFPSKMNLEDVFQRTSGVSTTLLLSDPEFHYCSKQRRRNNTKQCSYTSMGTMNFKSHSDDWNGNERIDGDHKHNSETATTKNKNKNNKAATTAAVTTVIPATKLTTLPGDVLCHNIGQYLRAKSLDSLRCTCKHLHWTLRAVVPGLKLRLYSHQIKSLMWMRGRESTLITEDDLLQTQQRQNRRRHCRPRQRTSTSTSQTRNMTHWIKNTPDGDAHRSATGGATVVLCPRRRRWQGRNNGICDNGDGDANEDEAIDADRNGNGNGNAAPVRISQLDQSEVVERRKYGNDSAVGGGGGDNPLARKVARGGLLCDDPGLGKTITVLSLILQTMGLSTEKDDVNSSNLGKSRLLESTKESSVEQIVEKNGGGSTKESSVNQPEHTLTPNNERIFDEYWKEQIIPEFRCKALTKLFSTFLRCSREINFFFDNYWIKELQANTTIAAASHEPPPLSLKVIRRRIDRSVYGDSLQGFVSDVESCFHIAISNDLVSDPIRQAGQRLVGVFRSQINEFKQSQIGIAIKSFSRASAKPDSMVAALIEKTNSEKLQRSLLPSSATLMVVPAVLVDHWMEQLRLNINLSYCTNRIPLVFEYTGSNRSNEELQEISLKCIVEKTHFPLVFVDRTATKKLPPPSFLAIFTIVLTTNNRFSCEWKNGSFEDEMRRNRSQDSRGGRNGRMTDFREDLAISEEACPLLKVNWLRMIVDEGHSMGRGRDNSSISFASWINAERRWAMTGTPTPQTSTQSGLMNVLNLMQYLQHDFFTRRHSGDITWNKLIVKSWNNGCVSAFFRLRSLLSMLMIRHIKSDISELPLPIFDTNTLSMGFEEVSTYNTLVCAIQSNLIITSMKGKTSGAQDSLLHKSQTRHAREAIGNLRLVCAGGTQVRPTLTTAYWIEFHQDFDNCNADPVQQKKIREFISLATTGQHSKCDCCSVMLSTLLVFPCGHLVCTECVDSNTTSCVVCDKEFDVDAFQRLQPGFKYDWLHNVEEETKRQSTDNYEKIEDVNEPSLLPGGHGLLIPHNQRRRRARTRKYGDGHTCEYDPTNPSGQCILCFTEHEPCYLAGERRCRVCYRVAQDCPASESKITHIIEKLLKLYRQQQRTKESAIHGSKKCYEPTAFLFERRRTPKVIIFSQFRKVLNITGDRLLRRFGSGCIAEYWGKYRKKELYKFIKDEECLCMLLGKDGSEGLDLSFVTHIIFLEQVWDKSLENQVVARAWRMGAKGSVDVETLVAENSIEQTMFFLERNLEQEHGDSDGSVPGIQDFRSTAKDKKRSEYQQAKVHYLLNNLKLIVNANTLDFSASNKRKAPVDQETRLDSQQSETKNLAKKNGQKRLRVKFQDQ